MTRATGAKRKGAAAAKRHGPSRARRLRPDPRKTRDAWDTRGRLGETLDRPVSNAWRDAWGDPGEASRSGPGPGQRIRMTHAWRPQYATRPDPGQLREPLRRTGLARVTRHATRTHVREARPRPEPLGPHARGAGTCDTRDATRTRGPPAGATRRVGRTRDALGSRAHEGPPPEQAEPQTGPQGGGHPRGPPARGPPPGGGRIRPGADRPPHLDPDGVPGGLAGSRARTRGRPRRGSPGASPRGGGLARVRPARSYNRLPRREPAERGIHMPRRAASRRAVRRCSLSLYIESEAQTWVELTTLADFSGFSIFGFFRPRRGSGGPVTWDRKIPK